MHPLLKIGTRKSPLALAQTHYVCDILTREQRHHAICTMDTTGDLINDRPLYDIGGKALFAKELEQQLLNGGIDMAVHSLKDLEFPRPKGLEIMAYLPRADARDVLIMNKDYAQHTDFALDSLGSGATVGTSSPRRAALIRHYRPDLHVVPIRGNIQTRLSKLYDSEHKLDAIILAKAGLDRMGLNPKFSYRLPYDTFIPAAGQGIIAVEARSNTLDLKQLFSHYNDPTAHICAHIEQGFIAHLDNTSCRSPIGVYAHIKLDRLNLWAMMETNNSVRFFHKVYPGTPTPEYAIMDLDTFFT